MRWRRAYLQRVDWEPRDALERRAAALLPGLLLARVDGKSPVEYLTTEPQWRTRAALRVALLRQPVRGWPRWPPRGAWEVES